MFFLPYWLSASIKLAIAASVFSILPSYLSAIDLHLEISSVTLGYLATTELLGFAIACTINFFCARYHIKINDNTALLLLCLCHICSAVITDVSLFFILRAIAGVCAGLVVVRSYEVLGREENPDAAFGRAIAIQMLTTAMLFLLLPNLMEHVGSGSFFLALGALVGATLLLKPMWVDGEDNEQNSQPVDYGVVSISLGAIAMVMLTHSAVWSTLSGYATTHHVELRDQGTLFAVGTLFSVAGAILATLSIVHRKKPLILTAAIGLQCFVVSTMLTGDNMYSFIAATCLFQLLWNLIVPLVMGTLASGRYAKVVIRFTLAAQTLGAALGPMVLVPGWVLPEILLFLGITYLLIVSIVPVRRAV
ncbi:MFS transporter [Vibrio agarivorans]|uniref:MFS transporter n=1 Tax=Vibrio agarivorans TaxID=153622 RepID=UPI00222EE096|nr:MFS transporter [Vibrio agarivorans]